MPRRNADLEAFEREFESALEAQGAAVQNALAELGEAQALFHVFLQHESRRVEGKSGPDHRHSRSLKATAELNSAQFDVLSGELEIGRIRVPPVAEGDALVHGRVREPDGRALPGATVCLVDQANSALAGIDSATTDRSGYYAITVPPAVGRYQQAPRSKVFLAVFTGAGKLLHRGKQPLELTRDARLQIEVTLDRVLIVESPERGSTEVEKERRKTPVATEAGPETQTADPVATVLAAIGGDRDFAEIGASYRKLENRLATLGLETRQALAGLLDQADREVRDGLRLPNLKSARAFKRLLAKVLEEAG